MEERIGVHACAEGGLAGVASRLGISTEEYMRRRKNDQNSRAARMRSAEGAMSEYENESRVGIRYCP
jgi:hypothetical protein